jgi:carbonic anhydrase
MKKPQLLALVAALVAAPVAWAIKPAHWSYSGSESPRYWGQLDPSYATCDSGQHQSPIDLRDFTNGDLKPIRFKYGAGGHMVLNDGRSIQVNYTLGSEIIVDGYRYELKQYSFHSPGEHYINGRAYPLEVQFFHVDGKGRVVAVSVMFELGKENKALDEIWDVVPRHSGDRFLFHSTVLASDLLPRDKSYYRYEGSLNTPPCTEGVTWLVMKQPLEVSEAQLEKFRKIIPDPNNRPLQTLNGRKVLR